MYAQFEEPRVNIKWLFLLWFNVVDVEVPTVGWEPIDPGEYVDDELDVAVICTPAILATVPEVEFGASVSNKEAIFVLLNPVVFNEKNKS